MTTEGSLLEVPWKETIAPGEPGPILSVSDEAPAYGVGADPTLEFSRTRMLFLVSNGDRETGPFSLVDVRRLLSGKTISSSDYLWCPGLAGWKRISSIPGLMLLTLGDFGDSGGGEAPEVAAAQPRTERAIGVAPRTEMRLQPHSYRQNLAHYDLARSLRRAFAFFLDAMILALICLAADEAAKTFWVAGHSSGATTRIAWVVADDVGFCWLYHVGFESFLRSSTPGKALLSIRVINRKGECPSILRSTLRFVAKIFSIGCLFVGCFFIKGTRRRRALHDLIAGTYVVRH